MAASLAVAVTLAVALLVDSAAGTLVESHYLSKQLQRALRHDDVVIVLEGVRRRLIGIPDPDPLLLINYPDLDNQFKVNIPLKSFFVANYLQFILCVNECYLKRDGETFCEDSLYQ